MSPDEHSEYYDCTPTQLSAAVIDAEDEAAFIVTWSSDSQGALGLAGGVDSGAGDLNADGFDDLLILRAAGRDTSPETPR